MSRRWYLTWRVDTPRPRGEYARVDGGGRLAGLMAGVAALIGAGLIAVAAVRFAGMEEPASTNTAPVTSEATTTTPAADPAGYVVVSDETGRITARVPAEWTDTSGSSWVTSNIDVGPSLAASVDIARWVDEWDTPGVFIGVDGITGRTAEELLAGADFEGPCTRVGRDPFSHDGHAGEVERYTGCGDAGSTFVQMAAAGSGHVVLLQLVVLDPSQVDPVLTGWSVAPG